MKVAVVTTHPAGHGTLSEYGYHFTRQLGGKPDVGELVLLVDGDHRQPDLGHGDEQPRAVACWRPGSLLNPVRIASAVLRERPDLVIFNIQYATFGSGRVAAALGLLSVPAVRLLGLPTIVLLHNLIDTVDLAQAGFRMSWLGERIVRLAGRIVTRLILAADLVAVTVPTYVELLRDRYGADNVLLAPHGSFQDPLPPESRPGPASEEDRPRLLAFGKFGTYKRIEALVTAVRMLLPEYPDLELVVAGTDSPNAVGYLAAMEEECADLPGVRFTGYVAEEDVPALFRSAGIVVFPYITTTGSSGVLHQAGEHARATVLPDIGDLAELIREEGYTGEFFKPDDPSDLAAALRRLLADPGRRERMGAQNLAAASGLPMRDIVDWYLIHGERLVRRRQLLNGA